MALYSIARDTYPGLAYKDLPKRIMLGSGWDDDSILEALTDAGYELSEEASVIRANHYYIEIDNPSVWLTLKLVAGRQSAKVFFRDRVDLYAEQYVGEAAPTAVLELRYDSDEPELFDSYVDGEFFGTFKLSELKDSSVVLGIGSDVVREGQVNIADEPDRLLDVRVALDAFLERGGKAFPPFMKEEAPRHYAQVGDRVRFATPEHKTISNYSIEISGMTGTVDETPGTDSDSFIVKLDVYETELRDWENDCVWSVNDGDEMPKYEILPEEPVELTVARRFAWIIRVWLTEKELREAIKENATRRDDTCASQDYCDANMAMLEAMSYVLNEGVEMEPEEIVDFQPYTDLWNTAWDIAKRNHFFVGPDFYPKYTRKPL